MTQVVKFSELNVGDEFFYEKFCDGRRKMVRTRFRKIDPSGLGDDLAEMNAIQLGGADGCLSVIEIENDAEVQAIGKE